MFLVYHPEGSNEPTVFNYNPRKLMSAEREALEKRTGFDFEVFAQHVMSGNSSARRALLHMFLKRDNPAVRYEDVDFAWDELNLEFSKQELDELKAKLPDSVSGDELAQGIAALDEMYKTARDDVQSGKALPKSDD